MKKNYYRILLGVALFTIHSSLFTSCDSLLEEDTDSFPSKSVIYSNDQSVESARQDATMDLSATTRSSLTFIPSSAQLAEQ